MITGPFATHSRRSFLLAMVAALAVACAGPPRVGDGGKGAIAMPDRHSAETVLEILDDGGNAVDAAIAAAFVLAVTYPEAGNIAGGGFMLLRFSGHAAFLDFREIAPAAATRDMYLDARGEIVDGASLNGHRAVAVPGTVAGLHAAHERYGTRPWHELLAPAIELAEDGIDVPQLLVDRVRDESPRLAGVESFARHFGHLRAGQTYRQPELAAALRRIARHGAAGFYEGETARLIVDEIRRGGGIVTAADLAAYRPRWREPLRSRWRDHEILAAPPPSSGGFAIVQLLKMKDALAPSFAGLAHNSAQYIHLTAEMEKRVFADRTEYGGDPDFVRQPVEQLIADDYIAARAAEVDPVAISKGPAVRPGLEGRSTSHFSIVDRDGNAAALTYTLNTDFGSGVVVEGGGFLLNNEMDDFSAKPGVTNYYGVTGAEANAIAPGKRMLSSMSPTILVSDGRVSMVLGSPGGSTIITSVYQAIVNVLDFGMSAQQAVAATRFHHQLIPEDLVTYSVTRPLPEEVVRELTARGYRAVPHEWEFGDLQLVLRTGDRWSAASDPRGRGESRVLD
ncbi:MAG TPA: gamma-glutamyltransferase [Steroidobacteraceae bacterium]|nr:gamma-glutamyltransferase [Steroidobacteraceae bacterium]